MCFNSGGLYLSSSKGKNNFGHNHSIQLVCYIPSFENLVKKKKRIDTLNVAFPSGINLKMVEVFRLVTFL